VIDDRYLVVRAAAMYSAAIALALAAAWRRPDRRATAGAILSFAWNLSTLFVLHLMAIRAGWWRYDADGGSLLGIPVDLWFAWAILWGPAMAIAMPRTPLWIVTAVALGLDLIAMPLAAPVVQLGSTWLIGEGAALAFCLVPSQLLARWTAADRHLTARAALQVITFSVLLAVLLPVLAIEGSSSAWPANSIDETDVVAAFAISVAVQLLCVPAIIGLTAVQEFVTRGLGTPVPFDPPRRIVTTGIYAYVANPMQLSAVLFLLAVAIMLGNVYVALAGVMAHVYSIGLAGWDEDRDLRERFGGAWALYRAHTRRWIPRWRPSYGDAAVARLYVASDCSMCQEVASWFGARGARGLAIVPAETHASPLTRITYASENDSYSASGVAAIARALEHVHFGWAMVGFALRLPVISTAVQLIVDASGGGPRAVRHIGSAAQSSDARGPASPSLCNARRD
jgi:protein-S-isoprenylcysteine O-methyltransferase Ste14